MSFDPGLAGQIISRGQPILRDTFGPTVEILTAHGTAADAPALVRGTVPGGVTVPMHAHGVPETFYVLSGQLQGLAITDGQPNWITVDAGQIFHVPSNARHALRNVGPEPAVALIVSAPEMADFFEQMGIPLDSMNSPRRRPNATDLDRMVKLTAEHGYWNASPAENAEVGIELPPPGP